jgi:hypothetical protein
VDGPEGDEDRRLAGHQAVVGIGEDSGQRLDIGPEPADQGLGVAPAGGDGPRVQLRELALVRPDPARLGAGEPAFRLPAGGQDGGEGAPGGTPAGGIDQDRAQGEATGDLDGDLADHHPQVGGDDQVAGLVVGDDPPAGGVDLRRQLPSAGARRGGVLPWLAVPGHRPAPPDDYR